jgi:hypothetical protein
MAGQMRLVALTPQGIDGLGACPAAVYDKDCGDHCVPPAES